MKFLITCDANWETRVDKVTDFLMNSGYTDLFEDRYYGDGLRDIFIVLMCRNPNLKFNQRVRFSKKEKTLYMDIMLDYDEMRQAEDDDRVRLVVEQLKNEIPQVLHKYSFSEFDETRFIKDLAGCFKIS